MRKTVLITGATDGIGLVTAQQLAKQDHNLLIHGRNPAKVNDVVEQVSGLGDGSVTPYVADLSDLAQVRAFAQTLIDQKVSLDAVINNAGVFSTANVTSVDGLDVRFAVNTIAPYLLTTMLLPHLDKQARVVNLSSAAQAPVDLAALTGAPKLGDNAAYAQSKLALTMWNAHLGQQHADGPVLVSVNPKSLLASKMVKDAYGIAGSDITVGADILIRAALSDEFADAHGKYFDNDIGRFAPPHPDAENAAKNQQLVEAIDRYLAQ